MVAHNPSADMDDDQTPKNPLDPTEALNIGAVVSETTVDTVPNPGTSLSVQDSALTKAEKFERPTSLTELNENDESPPQKRVKLSNEANGRPTPSERQKGVAPIKAEYVSLY